MFSLSDTPCQSILPNDGKIATKLWLAMGPFQIMLMSIRQTRSLDSRTYIYIYWYGQYPLWYPHALPPKKNIKHREILWIWLYDPPGTYRKPMVSNGIPTDFNLPKHFGETPVAAMQVFGKFNESWNTSARRCSRIFKTSLMYILGGSSHLVSGL